MNVTLGEEAVTGAGCEFCRIVAGAEPARIISGWETALAITSENPVVEGHILVIARAHVTETVEDPEVTADVVWCAAEYASSFPASNIIISVGRAEPQSVRHLYVHVVPRTEGDGLMLPWGTTGDLHASHRCLGMDALERKLAELEAAWPAVITDSRTYLTRG